MWERNLGGSGPTAIQISHQVSNNYKWCSLNFIQRQGERRVGET